MKRFPMYKELQFRTTNSLGAVLSRIRYPLFWKKFPHKTKLYSKSYTVKKLYNCIVVIRQIKRYYMYKQWI